MNDNNDDNVVHLNVVENTQTLEDKGRASSVDVLKEMLELAEAGEITEFAACSVNANGEACIHVSSADWLGAVGLFESGKHIFVNQFTRQDD